MTVDYNKLKVGDKVRYLGGYIPEHYGGLTIGKEYDVIGKDSRDLANIANDKGYGRFIGYYNAHCFELVDEKHSESTCKCSCKHDSHTISLAKEVAKLKRELAELQASKANREDVEKFAETASNAELLAKKALGEDHSLAHDIETLKQRLSDDELAGLGAEIVRLVERRKRYIGR